MNIFKRIKERIISERIKYLSGKDYYKKSKYGFDIILNVEKDVDRYFYRDYFEKENLEFFASVIKPGATILDVGANIGIYSLMASVKAGNNGKVYAFEPAEWAINRLKKNISINKFSNIEVIEKGVGEAPGHFNFYVCEDDAYNSLGNSPMEGVKEVRKIEVITVDDFVRERELSKVDVLKIDTEGADYLVLKGASSLLQSKNPPIIFCEYNKNIKEGFEFTLKDFDQFLNNMGYKVFELQNNRLIAFNSEISNSNEIICIKSE